MRHIECMAKVMLGTGLIVAYGYAMEAFMSWYSGNHMSASCSRTARGSVTTGGRSGC